MKKIIGVVLLFVGLGIGGFAAYGYFFNEYQNHCQSSTDKAAALFIQSLALKGTDRGRELLKEFELENAIATEACKNASQTQQRAMWIGPGGLVLMIVGVGMLIASRGGKNSSVLTLVLILTAFGVGCDYLKAEKNEPPQPSGESNSPAVTPKPEEKSETPTNSGMKPTGFKPREKADFQFTSEEYDLIFTKKEVKAADLEKYGSKNIEITGRVRLLVTEKKGTTQPWVTLYAPGTLNGVRCYFDDEDVEQMKTLTKDRLAKVQGFQDTFLVPKISPSLRHCVVLETN